MITTDSSQGPSLIDALLAEQQRTTAVERFAQLHDRGALPMLESHYRDLIPAGTPGDGEQYAFEVDLDGCSGCKSCVTACHSMNGLEPKETWRGVGLLIGGTTELPVIQHITTACHHCIDPACHDGCPVEAYEKDPTTGIVRHLDDQCIGCQYCILKCPYDVPKYSSKHGIVRKCDMCHDRLAVGEAPACVGACPNSAIRIKVVNQHAVEEECEANTFLPGAPEPGYTTPTTTYKSERALPRNLLPADYFSARPEHAHLPLVFMLVLTQMSVGAFVLEQLLGTFNSVVELMSTVRPFHLVSALLLGFLGLGAAILHLGRPLYAFRAIIGLRTSWLSREILAFGLFAMFASLYVVASWFDFIGGGLQNTLGIMAAVTGVAGVLCSIMIYVDTRRPFWNATFTTIKFIGTMAVLGIPVALLISLAAAAASSALTVQQIMNAFGGTLCKALVVISAAKLLFESLIFTNLAQKQHTPLKRTALLMTGELGLTTLKRFFFGVAGGILVPGVLAVGSTIGTGDGFTPMFVAVFVLLSLVALVIGELLERYLFFTAVVAPKMPGSPAS